MDSYLFPKCSSLNGEGEAFIDGSKNVSIGFAKVTFGPPEGIRYVGSQAIFLVLAHRFSVFSFLTSTYAGKPSRGRQAVKWERSSGKAFTLDSLRARDMIIT